MIDQSLAVEIAEKMVTRWEGLRLKPYLCPAGVPTIGYGATFYQSGLRVKLSDPALSKEDAFVLLRWMIERQYMPSVIQLCPEIDTSERLAALTDFAFNLGIERLKGSTLRKRVNAGRWAEVPGELMKWNKAGGVILNGLTMRRSAESMLI